MENKCVLCPNQITGYGNNPQPWKDDGLCCDSCNLKKVIPARFFLDSCGIRDVRDTKALMDIVRSLK